MASITVDPYNVNKPSNFVEEAGFYNVKIVDAHFKANSKGNDMITFDVSVLDGEYQGAVIKYNNMSWNEDDSDKKASSIKRFNSLAIALGAKKDATLTIEQIATNMIDHNINVYVDWEKPNNKGQSYLKTRSYFPVDEEGSKPNGKKNPTLNDPSLPDNGAPIDIKDDDLPF